MKTKLRNMIASSLIAMLAGVSQSSAVEWNMPTPYSDKTFHTVNIVEFAKDVEEATGGELKIKVHSAGSLLAHPEIKNAVRGAIVPIGEFFLSRLSNEDAAFGIDSQPFVATSYEDARKLWDAQKPVVTELLARQNLKPLFSVPWPPQGLYTRTRTRKASDLNGVKFRAYNASLEQFARLAGAAPVQVEAADLAQAFATGRVEAMITSPSTGANTKAWDYVFYYYPINAWIPKNIVVVNSKAFEGLSDDVKGAVLKAAAAAEKRGWAMSMKETETKTAILEQSGMNVVEPSAELIDGLKKIGVKMQEAWNSSASKQAKGIMSAFEK